MICLCSDESLVRARRSTSFRVFFASAVSGSSDVPATARRKSLVAGYRHKPCRDGRAPFEPTSLTPHVQKNFAQKVFGKWCVVDEANEPSINERTVSGKQRLHGKPVAESNPINEQLVS